MAKTLDKMSPAGRDQAVAVAGTLDERSQLIVTEATAVSSKHGGP